MNESAFLEQQASFWNWFSENKSSFEESDSEAPIFEELLQRLQTLDSGLYYMMSTNAAPKDFVITAEGNVDLFPFVDLLASSAPTIPGWTITALKPPLGFPVETVYEDVNLKPGEMWFLPLESSKDPQALGLRIAAPGVDPDGKWALAAVMAVLESGLGERSTAADIRMVELAHLPTNPEVEGYMEFADLPRYIAWRKKRLASNS